MSISIDQVKSLARLACIDVTDSEADVLSRELSQIIDRLGFVKNGISDKSITGDVSEPLSNNTGCFRHDTPGPVLDIAPVLSNGEDGMFRISAISGEDSAF
ncbi:Asp-tRNA(Asn)/Glu-tRNA(Gln) amidotransferase subunit GatC [Tropheryma whipplei]|uniref:Glutamyl-tRNA(Gln) amidotransferase subunit C n=1 Tax=Tropheryma whipplei (strain Twist) TaxID=203267 RepID=Q83GA0_TROWT|nr:Asp-tRNA(Asn)/Glu-tRNA(Gln) amidotransferase subunit GatC [Tropheryma whipplei]AAO44510.1 glutamyl-tRNA(Gln) amidotransferase subunit C [Tropheryma whipplei str. Twist]